MQVEVHELVDDSQIDLAHGLQLPDAGIVDHAIERMELRKLDKGLSRGFVVAEINRGEGSGE